MALNLIELFLCSYRRSTVGMRRWAQGMGDLYYE